MRKLVEVLKFVGPIVLIVGSLYGLAKFTKHSLVRFFTPESVYEEVLKWGPAPNNIQLCGGGAHLGEGHFAIAFKCEKKPDRFIEDQPIKEYCKEFRDLYIKTLISFGKRKNGKECDQEIIDALSTEKAECYYDKDAVTQVIGGRIIDGYLLVNNPETQNCLYIIDVL